MMMGNQIGRQHVQVRKDRLKLSKIKVSPIDIQYYGSVWIIKDFVRRVVSI